jgi:hypothetical protein
MPLLLTRYQPLLVPLLQLVPHAYVPDMGGPGALEIGSRSTIRVDFGSWTKLSPFPMH